MARFLSRCKKDKRRRGSSLELPLSFVLFFLFSFPPVQGSEANTTTCAIIKDDQLRLACYDERAPIVEQEVEQRVEKIDQQRVAQQTSRSQDFDFKRGRQPITAKIVELAQKIRGQWILTLDNGQVWTEVESGRKHYHVGQTVDIKPGFMNSHTLTIESIGSGKFKRVR